MTRTCGTGSVTLSGHRRGILQASSPQVVFLKRQSNPPIHNSSRTQRDRYADGQDHEGDAEYDADRRKQLADDLGGTPERAGNDEQPSLVERWCEGCPRQRWFFKPVRGERHGVPPSRSVGESR